MVVTLLKSDSSYADSAMFDGTELFKTHCFFSFNFLLVRQRLVAVAGEQDSQWASWRRWLAVFEDQRRRCSLEEQMIHRGAGELPFYESHFTIHPLLAGVAANTAGQIHRGPAKVRRMPRWFAGVDHQRRGAQAIGGSDGEQRLGMGFLAKMVQF
nr:hypothetical protein Iba_chr06aCG10390 [Ipomoea batatas]